MRAPSGVAAPEPYLARAAGLPAAAAGAVASAGAGVFAGAGAFRGAVFATLLVVAFFGWDLLLSHRTSHHDPHLVMTLAVASYATKVGLLALVLTVFRDTTLFDTTAFGLTVLLVALVWLAAQVRGFTRVRVLYVDPDRVRP